MNDLLCHENPDVVLLQEIKRELCDKRFVGSVWKVRNKEWAVLPASGASRGVTIFWDAWRFKCLEVVLGSFSVTIKLESEDEGSFWLSSVYGPSSSYFRKNFWLELQDLSSLTFLKWCVGGNFNVIRRISDKLGSSKETPSMRDFDDFMRECELINLPPRNASFTWSNLQENPVCKRLDRFLFSSEWEFDFPHCIQEARPRLTSDNCPIVLNTNPFIWGPTPFSFKSMWLLHSDFKDKLGCWWNECRFEGWEGHKFMKKTTVC